MVIEAFNIANIQIDKGDVNSNKRIDFEPYNYEEE